MATECPAARKGRRAGGLEGVEGGQAGHALGPCASLGDGGHRAEKQGPWEIGGGTESGASHQKGACCLPVGESNPGLPRDRRGYSPLY